MSSLLLALRARALLGEQLDDHLLLHRDLDVLPDGQPAHGAFLLVHVHLEPRRNLSPARAQIVGHPLLHLGRGADLHRLAHPHDVGGNGDLAAVDLDVSVADQLPRLAPRSGHAQAEYHVVQPPLEQLQQVLAGAAALALGHGEVTAELALQHTVDPLGLLLLAELDAVVRELRPGQPVLARGIVPPLDGALVAEAPRALEEQLDAFAPALPAGRCTISRQRSLLPYTRRRLGGRHPLCGIGVTSRIAEISRPTAWSDRMAASRPAPGPRTNTSTCLSPRSMALRAAFSAAVCAAKGVLLREPLKPTLPALAHETTLPILSVRVTMVLLKVACTWAMPTRTSLRSRLRPPLRGAAGALDSSFSAASSAMLDAPYFLGAGAGAAAGAAATGFFLTMTPLLLPLRVRAFVCVRCPRTGRPLRWRMPR